MGQTRTAKSDEYINQITVQSRSNGDTNVVAGTIIGRNKVRVVNINNFKLELTPESRFVMIHNHDKPGAIGSIGTLLGQNNINISKMRVGQQIGSDKTMIFLRTDTPIPEDVVEQMRALPLMISVAAFEL